MKKILLRTAIVMGFACSCLHALAQRGQGMAKASKLANDVQTAMPNARLSDDQKSKLQADIDGVNAAMKAREQGQRMDRDKLMAMIDEMRKIVDSGAFAKDDQAGLDKEFDDLKRR
jgi:hypothetical protein